MPITATHFRGAVAGAHVRCFLPRGQLRSRAMALSRTYRERGRDCLKPLRGRSITQISHDDAKRYHNLAKDADRNDGRAVGLPVHVAADFPGSETPRLGEEHAQSVLCVPE